MVTLWGRIVRHQVAYALVVLLSTATSGVMAQAGQSTFEATCLRSGNSSNGWDKLGLNGQDVCMVTRGLLADTAACGAPANFSLQPTDKNHPWYSVNQSRIRPLLGCACSMVMYNLLSACAGCQLWADVSTAANNNTWPSVSKYNWNNTCLNIERATPKRDIPWNGSLPNWATSNSDPFKLTEALATAGATPEPPVPAATSPNSALSSIAAASSTAVATSQKSHHKISAIIGGVIGGLAFLGILAGIGFWSYRCRRRAHDIAPSAEFLKPEYYATPPLLPGANHRRVSGYDEIGEVTPISPHRYSGNWVGGLVMNRREEEDEDGDMLPPFTQGTYIGPSPHEKGIPERRETGDSNVTNTTHTPLFPSSPTRQPGPSDRFA